MSGPLVGLPAAIAVDQHTTDFDCASEEMFWLPIVKNCTDQFVTVFGDVFPGGELVRAQTPTSASASEIEDLESDRKYVVLLHEG